MKPTVADNKPKPVELKVGENYFFCTCGLSSHQPFCDGSHKRTGMTPQPFKVDEDGKAHLCLCKQSSNFPYCDGTHAKIPADQVGKEFSL